LDEDIRAYEELSVDMMMSKPFDFDELHQALAVLNKKALGARKSLRARSVKIVRAPLTH
jgi:hypothetical protein